MIFIPAATIISYEFFPAISPGNRSFTLPCRSRGFLLGYHTLQGRRVYTDLLLALSIVAVLLMAISRVSNVLFGAELFNYALIQDLMIAWTALFLFGALWQSYETSIVMVPDKLEDR